MSQPLSTPSAPVAGARQSLRERNRQRVRGQIVDAAIALAHERGLEHVTADEIARRAGIGRATFFRYFDATETALVVGFYEKRLTVLVDVLCSAPVELAPVDALIWTFEHLRDNLAEQAQFIVLQRAAVARSSSLQARTVEYQTRYEGSIADAIAGRFKHLQPDDPRPLLLAAACMAVVRVSIGRWVDAEGRGDIARNVQDGLALLRSGFAG